MAKKKTEKASPFVPMEEQPYQVPENWCWVYGNDIFKPMETKKPVGHTFAYIDIDAIDNANQRVKSPKEMETAKAPSRASRGLHNGDTLFSLVRPYLKNIAYIDDSLKDCIASTGFYVCSPVNGLNSRYVYRLMTSDYVIDGLNQYMKGDNSPSIRSGDIENYPFPIPPLAEQQRIVDRIESLFAKLDEAKEKAQEALESFDLRKSAILNKAFDGSLTREWRQKYPDVSARPYLQKLKETGNGISRQEFDFWDNVELPNTWCESKIGKLLYFAGRIGWKGLKAEEYTEEGPLLLSVYNLNDGDEVTFHRVYHITKERYEESPEIMVQPGDVLLTKDGAGIGKLGYVSNLPQEATINSSLLLIRPGEAALSKYVYYLLLSPKLQDIVKGRITGSATPHLFQKDIKEFVIPVPPIEEQTEMVRILDHFFEKENQAKVQVEFVMETIDTMKKSILSKAFRGELGTNNPEDENAMELLKRTLA